MGGCRQAPPGAVRALSILFPSPCGCSISQSVIHYYRLAKLQCLPFKGSAIESRVYAEDPLRLHTFSFSF